MRGTKNINKKLLIVIFTALFLVGFIYSVYSQATSAQNNAVGSLESNSIIQEIISSASSGYSSAGQYLANFLSIKAIPSYIWTIITFLITTLFFVAIYLFLFEIFVQRVKITESETMRKAKILFVFALSVFSAIAIGYAIPFLLNLYGLILLILVLIALFFFGRAVISYGRSFHYVTKSFEADVKKDLLKAMGELEELKNEKNLSKEDVMNISELSEEMKRESMLYDEFKNVLIDAENKFKNALSNIIEEHEAFFNSLINNYKNYLNSIKSDKNSLIIDRQNEQLNNFIGELEEKKNEDIEDIRKLRKIQSMKELHDYVSEKIQGLKEYNDLDKQFKEKFKEILNSAYNETVSKYHQKILDEIETSLSEYNKVEKLLLQRFFEYQNKFERKINSRLRKFLDAPDKLEKIIKKDLNLVDKRIKLLTELRNNY